MNKRIFKTIVLYVILAACIIAAFALINRKSFKAATASEEVKTVNYTLQDKFCDDSVLIVLTDEASRYSGISSTLNEKLLNLDIAYVTDLTEFPQEFLDSSGNLDKLKVPELYKFYENNSFSQILKIGLKTNDKQIVLDMVNILNGFEEVSSASPNIISEGAASTPNDSRLKDQWGLIGENGIHMAEAWEITVGSPNVRVGVIDSGIYDHDDLKANLVQGYDYYNNNNITTDDYSGHGTYVASVIGAVGNNRKGITGVAQEVTLVPLQTINDKWLHDAATRIQAITVAKNLWDSSQRISVLNHSIGAFGESVALLSAIKDFPGLFVWSAGNSGANVDNFEKIGMFDLPNLISVGATNEDGERWTGSNYGNAVDIYAPGEDILMCTTNDSYWTDLGTSFAAPHVSGVAALMLSIKPDLNGAQLKQAILNGADNITISTPAGKQNVKKLNAYKALLQLADKDENGYYFEEFDYQNFSMYYNIDLNTICCRPDGSYEVMDNGQGILGGFNGMSVSLCDMTGKKINFSEWTFFESELVIYTQGIVNSGCYVYDDNGNYLDECTFSMDEGALHVPLNELFNRGLTSFVLVPEYWEEFGGWSGTYTVGFSPSDVYLNLFARKYV